jgi:hypothetical protein
MTESDSTAEQSPSHWTLPVPLRSALEGATFGLAIGTGLMFLALIALPVRFDARLLEWAALLGLSVGAAMRCVSALLRSRRTKGSPIAPPEQPTLPLPRPAEDLRSRVERIAQSRAATGSGKSDGCRT